MEDDPLPGLGLNLVTMADQAEFQQRFETLSDPLSDYTFAQVFTWGNSLRIFWKEIRGHLCVFANGTGDLTLLMPPIGDCGGLDRALAESFEIMDAYNVAHQANGHSRVEYVSQELLARIDRAHFRAEPMGADYIYDVRRMIDLAGGDLASKRQLKNRFLRLYDCRVEDYDPAQHRGSCVDLLNLWKAQQDAQHCVETLTDAFKRQKESIACQLALDHAHVLGLKGMVVFVRPKAGNPCDDGEMGRCGDGVTGSERAAQLQIANCKSQIPEPRTLNPEPSSDWRLAGFTFGEELGRDQSSILIEKTDLRIRGLAQFIFSEFCARAWAHRPLVNAGDDWGLKSLAWTKMSYRPVRLLQKYTLRMAAPVSVSVPVAIKPPVCAVTSAAAWPVTATADRQMLMFDEAVAQLVPVVRPAGKRDLDAVVQLENICFTGHRLSRRRLAYLQQRPSATFLVAEVAGRVIGEGICLIRQHKSGPTGRIYSLAVSPEWRRQKLGQRLLTAMLAALGARGVRRVYLEVEAGNASAIALYERNGFRGIGTLPDYYGDGQDGLHMMCEVPASAAAQKTPGSTMEHAGV